MEEREVKAGNKTFKVRELYAVEFDEISKSENSAERISNLVKKSTNLTDEEYKTLTLKERDSILKVVNELNGWTDFQKSETESTNK